MGLTKYLFNSSLENNYHTQKKHIKFLSRNNRSQKKKKLIINFIITKMSTENIY